MKFLRHKLSGDIAWSMGSFVVLAACGMGINLLIAGLRDASALGAFNQSYAIYVAVSQVAVFGLHYSVMRHSALHGADPSERGRLLINASFFAVLLGAVSCLAVYTAAPLASRAFDSPTTGMTLKFAAPGLLFFPLNKILLAYLNGLRRMRAFAIFQSFRYISLTVWVSAVAASSWPFERVAFGFFMAEITMLFGILMYLPKRSLMPPLIFDGSWTGRHFAFGGKSLLAGMFVELNSRVDVMILGLFLPDRSVGIYSFAAMLVDGMYQILGVIRTTFNPVLIADLRDANWDGLKKLLSRSKRLTFPLAAVLATSLILAFWVLAAFVMPSKGLQEGMPSLIILLSSLTLISGFVPFDNLMMASGYPEFQTLQQLIVICTNVILNAIFIPHMGITGASLGTAISYLIGIVIMMFFVRRKLNWNLLTNFAWR